MSSVSLSTSQDCWLFRGIQQQRDLIMTYVIRQKGRDRETVSAGLVCLWLFVQETHHAVPHERPYANDLHFTMRPSWPLLRLFGESASTGGKLCRRVIVICVFSVYVLLSLVPVRSFTRFTCLIADTSNAEYEVSDQRHGWYERRLQYTILSARSLDLRDYPWAHFRASAHSAHQVLSKLITVKVTFCDTQESFLFLTFNFYEYWKAQSWSRKYVNQKRNTWKSGISVKYLKRFKIFFTLNLLKI